jgi:hypothetical protein
MRTRRLTTYNEAAKVAPVTDDVIVPGRAARAYLREIGRRGGLARSTAKTQAARANAKRPRPGGRKKRESVS